MELSKSRLLHNSKYHEKVQLEKKLKPFLLTPMTSLPQELLKQVAYPRSPRLISASLTDLEDTMENVI